MGTIAARDCLRVLELTEQVAAGLLIAVNQAVWLRMRSRHLNFGSSSIAAVFEMLSEDLMPVVDDRRLDRELQLLLTLIRAKKWSF